MLVKCEFSDSVVCFRNKEISGHGQSKNQEENKSISLIPLQLIQFFNTTNQFSGQACLKSKFKYDEAAAMLPSKNSIARY
jgi:hypothetical protein